MTHLLTAAAAARSILAARHPEQSWIVQVGEGQRVDKDRTITPRARFVQLGLQDFNGNAGAGSPRLNLPRLIRDQILKETWTADRITQLLSSGKNLFA